MSPFPRQLGRVCIAVIAVHLTSTCALLGYGRFKTDQLFDAHWRYSTPVHVVPRNRYCFWRRSFYEPCLGDDARECFLTALRAFSLQTSAITSKEISPTLVVQDTLCRLDGRTEFRDGVYLLERLLDRVEVSVKEVRQEIQGREATFVHAKVALSVIMKVPWTAYSFHLLTMPVAISLQLQHAKAFNDKQIVTAIENRWFGGSICSVQTGSTKSPWGDVGDLVRRYNGYVFALLLTKQENLHNRIDLGRLRATMTRPDSAERHEAGFVRTLSGNEGFT